MQKKRALVESGGAAKGAFQAGACLHLIGELKRVYDIFCGVSVGGIGATHKSQYKTGEEEECANRQIELWKNLKQKRIYKAHFPFGLLHALWRPSLYNSAPLREFLEEFVDADKIRGSGKALRLGTVSLDTGKYMIYDETAEDIIGACYNSASFPVAFTPTVMDGELQTDGGVRNVTPIGAAIKAGATDIDVIMTSPKEPQYKPMNDPNAISVMMRVVDIMSDEIIRTDIVEAQYVNQLVVAGASDKRVVNINVLRPERSLTDDSLDFSPEKIEVMIETGYELAKKWAAEK